MKTNWGKTALYTGGYGLEFTVNDCRTANTFQTLQESYRASFYSAIFLSPTYFFSSFVLFSSVFLVDNTIL